HVGKESRVAERLAEHSMAKRELRMTRSHVSQRGKAFQHIGIIGQEVIDAPGRVEMAGDQVQGAVEVFDECGPARYVPCTVRHNEAELDACHMSLAFQEWPNGLRLRSTLWVPTAAEKSSETE